MPDCIYFENLCSASVDGTLTRAEKKELEAHLAECPACREYLEDMRVMRTLWRELDDPAPAALHGSIMAAVQADLEQQQAEKEAETTDNVVSIPIGAPVPLQAAKKRMRSVILMLGAAAACVGLVVSGGLSGGLIGDLAGSTAMAAPAAEAPAAAAPQEPMMYTMESTAKYGARLTADEAVEDSAPEESVALMPAAAAPEAESDLPMPVAERQFAVTYLAIGTGELPVIDGAVLLAQEDNRSYYSLPHDISVLEDALGVLPQAGYTVTVTASTTGEGTEGNITDMATHEVLLIVLTEE